MSLQLPRPRHPLLIVGDIICDHYVWGDVERISPEAPVQVLRWEREADRPGGAANVAMNLAALGCQVHLAGVVGNDAPGRWLLKALRARGIETRSVIVSPRRPTTTKTRVIARGQHLLRIDRETREALDAVTERRLVSAIEKLNSTIGGTICSDYGKGVLTPSVLRAALRRTGGKAKGARAARPVVLVDPKGRDFGKYRGADVLTPNDKEFTEATGPDGSIEQRAKSLINRLGLKALLVTRGAEGMDLFEHEDGRRGAIHRTQIPVLQRHEVFDVTGAGDTVAAVMGLASAAGVPWVDAARLANAAAGIVVGTVGTAVAESETLAGVVAGEASQARSKVLSRAALTARVADARAHGVRIVLTNGCFDLLHVGHLHLLQRARALGDILVVAINDDASVKRLKGQNRPLIPEVQRAEMLAALRFVDYVTLFSELTPLRLIQAVRPDVLVKGGDYTPDQVVGRDVVERYGGRIEIVPLLPGLSTSGLVDAINRRKTS
ncbi:MAG TPA: D-glycero-beta-D-manno-heptose 1-phosphate adenylyltransferase [Vicinamibacterales bacterium]|nr:D-glycero-beta-D-manno-heptose 1-phosphate adenylyltransferase [Vicinamibacterales bacterium]